MQTETTHNPAEVMKIDSAHVLQTYRRAPVVFERGEGCRLFDAAGRSYLDFISGIGVSALGHAHPRLTAAIGAQAVEACLKFARRYWHSQGKPRTQIVALERGFHGRTMGALSVTWDEHYRAPFAPLLDGVTFVSPSDPAGLQRAVTNRTAAIIVEPLQ